MHERAYSVLQIKSVNEEARTIEGFASTPAPDRVGDVMLSKGARFQIPLPLLWQHQHDRPLGHVTSARVTAEGIYIRAQIAAKGTLGWIDEAFTMLKSGLVRGLSIGWRPLERPDIKDGERRYSSWEILEISTVTVPANSQATILSVKSSDSAFLAASGTRPQITHPPGVSGLSSRNAMTISEQVKTAQADLMTKSTRLEELITKAAADGGLEAAEQSEREGLKVSVKSLTENLDDLQTIEAAQAKRATVIVAPRQFTTQTQTKVEVVTPTLAKGTLFTRYAMAVAAGRGSFSDTLAYAKRWDSQTPEVSQYIKAMQTKAVEGTADHNSPGWGSQLVYPTNLAAEFIELLRAATVMGRINGFRNVPFNVRIPKQIGGSTVNWVGESAPKPVTELAFDTVTLAWHKIAGIVVLTEELVRLSSPSAEEVVRRDLVEQIARFMDEQFLDPAVTATADRPASITNGVSSPAASGSTAEDLYFDLNIALSTFDTAEVSTASLVIVMTPALARGISTLRNALGQFEFPQMSMLGGTLMGFPVIVSNSVPSGTIILIAAGEIFVAKDDAVRLDASREATIDMAGGSSPAFSLWQKNCIGIRAEQFADWVKRRDESVAIIDTASYGPTAPAS